MVNKAEIDVFWNSLAFYHFIPEEVVHSLTTGHGGMDKATYNGSVQFSLFASSIQVFVTPWTAARQASLPLPTPRVYPNSCPLSR